MISDGNFYRRKLSRRTCLVAQLHIQHALGIIIGVQYLKMTKKA